jgi:Flp pilus assembly pilin Flp
MRRNEGQDLLEYGVLVALIVLVVVGTVGFLGDQLNRFFWQAIGPSI